jgi:hypothetical protein
MKDDDDDDGIAVVAVATAPFEEDTARWSEAAEREAVTWLANAQDESALVVILARAFE